MNKKITKRQRRQIATNKAEKLNQNGDEAIVVAQLGWHVVIEYQKQQYNAICRKNLGDITCNDRVIISQKKKQYAIELICPRNKTLYKYSKGQNKAIASNIEQLLIVIATLPQWQLNLVDRHIIAANYNDIEIAIFCNKIDIATKEQLQMLKMQLKPYENLNYPIFYGSIYDNRGLIELSQWLQYKNTVICGQSGVGKSSLINYLTNSETATQKLSDNNQQGKHTTTNSYRYSLQCGGYLIDTPGVRSFAIHNLNEQIIINGFRDIAIYANNCRFRNCDHQSQEDCAVIKAMQIGDISAARYQSLLDILKEYNKWNKYG